METMMSKDLQLKLKNNLVITSLDGEGLVLDLDTRKFFWINETAAFLLKLFKSNREGVPLSSVESFLQKQYLNNSKSKMTQDLNYFINYIEWYGLVSPQSVCSGTKLKNLDSGAKKPYLKPMIEEDTDILSIGGNVIRAARSAAARSAAVSRATEAGFRGFR